MPKMPSKTKRPWVQEYKPFERITNNNGFYNSWKWRKFAKRYKERNPLCVKCTEENRIGPAHVADHITRIQDGGKEFDESNIQSLCEFHHNQKSGKEAHGYKQIK